MNSVIKMVFASGGKQNWGREIHARKVRFYFVVVLKWIQICSCEIIDFDLLLVFCCVHWPCLLLSPWMFVFWWFFFQFLFELESVLHPVRVISFFFLFPSSIFSNNFFKRLFSYNLQFFLNKTFLLNSKFSGKFSGKPIQYFHSSV